MQRGFFYGINFVIQAVFAVIWFYGVHETIIQFFTYIGSVTGALILAYLHPSLIPGIKGISRKKPWRYMWIHCSVMISLFVIFALTRSDVIRILSFFWGFFILTVINDDFPEDKWRSNFSSDKVKELAAKVRMIHNVPKPSVT